MAQRHVPASIAKHFTTGERPKSDRARGRRVGRPLRHPDLQRCRRLSFCPGIASVGQSDCRLHRSGPGAGPSQTRVLWRPTGRLNPRCRI